jgi:hypothetical protein
MLLGEGSLKPAQIAEQTDLAGSALEIAEPGERGIRASAPAGGSLTQGGEESREAGPAGPPIRGMLGVLEQAAPPPQVGIVQGLPRVGQFPSVG